MTNARHDHTDLTAASWRTSTYSGGNNECVEVAINLPHSVPVRDTKNKGAGPILRIAHGSWAAFLAGLR
ncbi:MULTISPECIES: DUF397 domain-containing protein [unclassified Streptomyces]|uniref:DUF397 domain-containing protein n=1 Tax=unclassified Streptomyces TaxID=2593676 RepID=UPI002DD9EF69|nr:MULTISPECIES: DUF397 domain-containing protein [unclassified Streptomyces]WSA92184.1 DUF397 domain-containing protein [Streptomyces sp. NBC_01795]WSB76550.1 DUF397 domain-containing protein [Streptomyces sp. NBC_01775]WSS15162.1 DUF397 domain-containing protein [Streptomyces sp. NBC_01186]WSS44006.1 DUF397 domain-containing protein [Streptomyces sp. NBC_01187]